MALLNSRFSVADSSKVFYNYYYRVQQLGSKGKNHVPFFIGELIVNDKL